MNASSAGPGVQRWPALVLAVLVTGGCAIAPQTRALRESPPAPVRAELYEVPFFAQDTDQCGPAALAGVLGWSGIAARPESLRPEVYLPGRGGSLQLELQSAARRHGRVAYVLAPRLDALLAEVAAGHPVIVLQDLGALGVAVWHYAVMVGFDVPADRVVLHSGGDARRLQRMELFEDTWRRAGYWALVVLPPGELPARAEEDRYLLAVAALEQTGRFAEAVVAYAAAARRWPGSLGAQMGLGNARYALHDLRGAESAYREAAARHPQDPAAFNNLAQVLADQDRLDAAERAARQAVALGGPLSATCRQTLEEILQQRAGSRRTSSFGTATIE